METPIPGCNANDPLPSWGSTDSATYFAMAISEGTPVPASMIVSLTPPNLCPRWCCSTTQPRSRSGSLRTSEIRLKCFGAVANGGTGKLGRREALNSLALVILFVGGSQASGFASQTKNTNLTIEEIKSIIENDISKGQYYVTGNLTKEIYEDNCRFKDPTVDLIGLEKYVAAIKFLFNPNSSRQELISIAVVDPHTIEAKWRLEGYLKFPWNPHILPYEGSTRYVVNDRGLITSHEETWEISVWTAFIEFLLPSWRLT